MCVINWRCALKNDLVVVIKYCLICYIIIGVAYVHFMHCRRTTMTNWKYKISNISNCCAIFHVKSEVIY